MELSGREILLLSVLEISPLLLPSLPLTLKNPLQLGSEDKCGGDFNKRIEKKMGLFISSLASFQLGSFI